MTTTGDRFYSAPVFLATAFLLFGLSLIEKVLNLFGWSMPFVNVYPRQLLEWAVILLLFEVALTLRQLMEVRRYPNAQAEADAVRRELH